MLTKDEIANRYERIIDELSDGAAVMFLDELYAHIREQDAELTSLRFEMDERSKRTTTIHNALIAANDRVRELEAGEAEAREMMQSIADGFCKHRWGARVWLAHHPAPKGTP